MQLSDFIDRIKNCIPLHVYPSAVRPSDGITLLGITDDSRKIQVGQAFIAITSVHIEKAIKKGACLVVGSKEACQSRSYYPSVCFIETSNPRLFLAHAAALFFPGQPDHVVAVTGTNGKTSVVNFVRQIWEALDYKAASLGTLGVQSRWVKADKHLTTPDPLYLHEKLRELHQKGITHLAMEASSHGIDQYRLDQVHLQAAAFTNLSPDHLEYHGNMENYLQAKMALFERILPGDGTAVLNADIPEFVDLLKAVGSRKKLTYGYQGKDIQVNSVKATAINQTLDLTIFGKPYMIVLPLIGDFQVANVLCALGLVLAIDPCLVIEAVNALEHLESIPGRLEWVGSCKKKSHIYVDYAHASGGIETLLKSLRKHAKGRLWIVFGAGGGRDPSTRPLMGEVAQKHADQVIITDDNPRFENPEHIRQQIINACPKAIEIGDRKEAIRYAIQHLEGDDLLVVAGKGPEDGQIIKGTTYPFLDKTVVQQILKEV